VRPCGADLWRPALCERRGAVHPVPGWKITWRERKC
jgi:hypothetical protein